MSATWRPRFHVTGERGWINDPNGPIQHRGTYHLFFQAHEASSSWGPPSWGHVSSRDLVTWRRHPPALVPQAGGPDAGGCWSGCARVVDGRLALYYTGAAGEGDARVESVCRAWGSEDGLRWEKDPGNPLVAGPPAGLGGSGHRDPFLWRDAAGWHLLLGSGTAGHGRVLRYDSPDATVWTYGAVFFECGRTEDGVDLGTCWECPQLVLAGDAAALVVSCQDPAAERPLMHGVAFTGRVRHGRFEGRLQGRLDHGDVAYAPALCRDEAGRGLMWSWAQERLDPDREAALSHAGALTLPCVVTLEDGRLAARPAPELDGLAREPLAGPAAQLELRGEVEGTRGRAGWVLAAGGDEVAVALDLDARRLEVSAAGRELTAPLALRPRHELRVFADGSLIEVFTDDTAVTTRAYPERGAWEVEPPVAAGGARLTRARAWRLAVRHSADGPPGTPSSG